MDNAPTNDRDVKIAIIKAATEIIVSKRSSSLKAAEYAKDWQTMYDVMAEKALKSKK